MSTYQKYRDTALGTTKTRLAKRVAYKRRKQIYDELCQKSSDHKANWEEAGVVSKAAWDGLVKKEPPDPIRCWRGGKTLYAGQDKAAQKTAPKN